MSCLMLIERPKVTEAHGYLDDDDDGVFVVECCPLVHMYDTLDEYKCEPIQLQLQL